MSKHIAWVKAVFRIKALLALDALVENIQGGGAAEQTAVQLAYAAAVHGVSALLFVLGAPGGEQIFAAEIVLGAAGENVQGEDLTAVQMAEDQIIQAAVRKGVAIILQGGLSSLSSQTDGVGQPLHPGVLRVVLGNFHVDALGNGVVQPAELLHLIPRGAPGFVRIGPQLLGRTEKLLGGLLDGLLLVALQLQVDGGVMVRGGGKAREGAERIPVFVCQTETGTVHILQDADAVQYLGPGGKVHGGIVVVEEEDQAPHVGKQGHG